MSYSNSFPTQNPVLNLNFATGSDQFLDSRLSYSRSSTGTAFSAEKHLSSENLLPYSNDLSNASWTKSNTTASSGATGPDGTANASSVLETTANDNHTFYDNFEVVSGVSYTYVAFVKANGRTKVKFQCQAQPTIANVEFDLTAVTSTVLTGSAVSHAIVASGGTGWYRCSVTVVAGGTGAGYHQIHISNGSSYSYAGDVTKGIYISGTSVSSTQQLYVSETSGQLHREFAPTLKSYSSDQPRFEYSATDGQSEGLLIESQATNKATYSEDFTNATYNKYRATIESASAIAPDGTLTASLLREDATASNTHFLNAVTATGLSVGTTQYAVSIFAKAAGRSRLQIYDNNQNTSGSTTFDLSNGTVVTGDGSIKSCGNGWYRCTIIPTANYSATSSVYMLLDNGSGTSYTGNSYSGILVWGYQLETGVSASSSYIKSNSGSSTTRSTDSCSVATSSFYTGGPVTIVGEVNGSGSGYRTFFDIRDTVSKASGVNAYLMVWKTNISDTDASNFKAFIYSDNVQQANLTISQSGGATTVAARMDTNNVGVCADGGAVTTDTSAVIPDSLDTLYIGRGYSGYELGSTIKRLAIYNVALSDVELQSLTTS